MRGTVRVRLAGQKRNAPSPMEVTESGIVTEVREMQQKNARSPMEVTESGMETEVRESQE